MGEPALGRKVTAQRAWAQPLGGPVLRRGRGTPLHCALREEVVRRGTAEGGRAEKALTWTASYRQRREKQRQARTC